MKRLARFGLAALGFALPLCASWAAPLINEIMFHPPGLPEDPTQEWVEIFNPDPLAPLDLSGWKLSKGVDFVFPAGTTLAGGGYLVVAASVAAFNTAHPGFTEAPVIGGWSGTLSNSGNTVRLENALGQTINEVSYANEGDWALRARGALDLTHQGWDWVCDADGAGKTLELINPALAGENNGQNWAVSATAGGTPGTKNGAFSNDVAPLISNIKHRPHIPRSIDPIKISAHLAGELSDTVAATLKWRLDGTTPFNSMAMSDSDGDGELDATIPAQANLAIVEFYISASDAAGNTRTWPAAARTSGVGVTPETFGQVTNALVQVDNTFNPATVWAPGTQPIYRVIMTAAERAELNSIWTVSAQDQSNAAFNMTFLTQDGTGLDTNYRASVRNRGNGSRLGPPNNSLVSFPTDALWNGRKDLALNCRYPHSQNLGWLLMSRMGVTAQDTAAVQVRYNGVNLAQAGAVMYGTYARVEQLGSDWVKHHFPLDSNGNFYQVRDVGGDALGGNLRYEGTAFSAYADSYFKQTNVEAADWSDVVHLTDVLNNSPAAGFKAAVSQVLDLDQWLTYLAANSLIGNLEGGISTGRGDDYSLYRGVLDPRFRLVEHDLDTTMSFGGVTALPNNSIFTGYETLPGLSKLLNDPTILPDYYAKYLDLMNRVFNPAAGNVLIDQAIGYLAASQPAVVTAAKTFLVNRRAGVLAQIQQVNTMTLTTSGVDVDGFKRTDDGAATISGTFNVAKVRSLMVNGTPATLYYRTNGTNAAGTWKIAVTAGSGFFKPGINPVVANFYDGENASGNVLASFSATVFFSSTASQTSVSGTLSPPGSLGLTAAASYVPGVPMLVRVDLKDTAGKLDRQAWTRTATLAATNSVTLTPNTVTLYNGVGSALVTVGGGGALGGTTQLIPPGGTLAAPNASGPSWKILDSGADPGTAWQALGFVDTAWKSGPLQAGAGDGDERTLLTQANVTGSATNTRRAFYFRQVFNVTDPAAYTALKIKAVIDDGAVFYLNGTEIARDNMPAGAVTMTTPAPINRAAPAESTIFTFDVSAFLSLLKAGNNILAVEVHNFSNATPSYSADLSFDCELDATTPPADPGSFTLSASIGTLSAQKAVASLAAQAQTSVSGALPAGATTTWSGIVHVTGDVTVPADATLAIAAGTHVLVDGTSTAGDTAGARIVVNGTFKANGTLAAPVSITASNAAARWGQILFSNAQPSTFDYVLLSHAGHSTGVGHTGKAPALRLTASSVTLNDSVLADGPAKAIYTSGTSALVLERSLLTRFITGPELEDGCSLLIEDSNIQFILPIYRESNDPVPDDEDCLYVHNSTGRPVVIRRSVFARCGDDAFDCLAGPITVEDSILREAWDKGMSLLNNDLNISRTLIIDCDKAIVPKCNSASGTVTINVDRVTMVSEDHDTTTSPWGYTVLPSSPDADTASTGLYTQNKTGQSAAGAQIKITASNCIIEAKEPVKVDPLYPNSGTVLTFSNTHDVDTAGALTWTGAGNVEAVPLFFDATNKDFHLTGPSPAVDSGDPLATLDADGTRADMGALALGGGSSAVGTLVWSPGGGPYHVTGDVTVPAGLMLVIQAGTNVQFDQNKRLTVKGGIQVQGTRDAHVVFSHVPGTVAAGDCDPIKNGVQTGPPKWGGLRIVDSMAAENKVAFADFINAQGTSPASTLETEQENWGSLGAIRSWVWVDHCTWTGSHLRWCYGRCAKLTVSYCTFGDMFDATEAPPADFVSGADNRQEPLKVEYVTTDTALTGNAAFVSGFPVGGWFRVYYNDFYGNKGHNDVFDVDGGRVGTTYPLDCRFNYFHGLTGDEHMDLKGDALIASNIVERGTKDQWTSDTGYSNAISTDNVGAGTTIMVARNLFFDIDHAANLKGDVAAYFEHNTCANFHADFHYVSGAPFNIDQQVKCSIINVFVPEDGTNPPHGDGFYMGYNVISGAPRLVSSADTRKINGTTLVNDITTKIEFHQNLVDQITDPSIGANHPGTIFNSAFGSNLQAPAGFTNAASRDFSLILTSAARGAGPDGLNLGHTIPEWAYIAGGPAPTTFENTASFLIGGPGLIQFKWRLDGGAWSAPITIGSGAVYPRTGATVRQAPLSLTGLGSGSHTLEVLGADFAGNWQDADPARSIAGIAQAAPTRRTWTVDPTYSPVRISEVLADSATAPDAIELLNTGTTPVNIGGYSLSDNPLLPNKYVIPSGITLEAGAYFTVISTVSGISLDKDGDAVYLHNGAALVDSVVFGHQIADLSLSRIGRDGAWTLGTPTLGAANVAVTLGDPSLVRLSEWFASGKVLYNNDWVELSNPGAFPVSIAGMRLSDNAVGNPSAHVLAPLSFMGATSFLKLIADGNASTGPTHLSFTLDVQQESLALFSATGAAQDIVFFGPQTTDYSQGLNAGGLQTFYELPTASLPNGTADPAYANALALLRALRISEIMFNPLGGSDYEFIELTNVSATVLELGGVKLVNGIDFTFPPLSLDAGRRVVLVSNLAKFRARYGNGPNVGGVYSGKLDNSGEGLAVQLPPPFDANLLSFSYSNAWQAGTNGYGKSLVVLNSTAVASQWGDRDTWAASASSGGDPDGFTIAPPDNLAGWSAYFGLADATLDGDSDGLPAFAEYALGLDPTTATGTGGILGRPVATLGANGHLQLRFSLPLNGLAAQVHGLPNVRYTVEAADALNAWTPVATKDFTTLWNGPAVVSVGASVLDRVPLVIEDPLGGANRFLRLRVTILP